MFLFSFYFNIFKSQKNILYLMWVVVCPILKMQKRNFLTETILWKYFLIPSLSLSYGFHIFKDRKKSPFQLVSSSLCGTLPAAQTSHWNDIFFVFVNVLKISVLSWFFHLQTFYRHFFCFCYLVYFTIY